MDASPLAPLERTTPAQVFETGLRAIDGLFTTGVGQRVGVFAAAGAGKSTLLARLARSGSPDRCVVCLVGERGREIEALWARIGRSPRAATTTLVAAASDHSAAQRIRAVDQALALAEHWRARGLHVLFLLDSVTRLAMALREIGLAAGEPATVRAYTPGAFAALPRLVERCGALKAGGAITAFMTILAENDDVEDPISEVMRSLLDGHILLSRELSEQGVFPAIDVPRSLSRLAQDLVDPVHRDAAAQAMSRFATYDRARTLVEAGVYTRGSSAEIDVAIASRPALLDFLRQEEAEVSSLADTRQRLFAALATRAH